MTEETLNNKKFVESKMQIVGTIKNIYSQIIDDIEKVVEDINSEKLTENLTISIEFLKEIKEHKKNKYIKQLIYN